MAGNIEVRQVEEVEKFTSNFGPHAFRDRESLGYVEVDVLAWPSTQN